MSSYIPKHIQLEFLRWLPVKSLLRFRCVCKSWKQHIDSQAFIHDHLVVQKPRLLFQYYEENELLILNPHQSLPISFNIITNERDYVVGTHHGVVCLFDNKSTFHLWNPSTRKLLTLPEPDSDHVLSDRDRHNMNLDQEFSYTSFWIDPCNNNFKLIQFNLWISEHDLFYSSGWKSPPDVGLLEDCSPLSEYHSVLIRGVAYWGAHVYDYENLKYNLVVICFDFREERFDLIKSSPLVKHCVGDDVILYECQGGLCLACLDSKKRCDLYSRQEDRWVNLFSFNLGPNVNRIWWVMGGKEDAQEKARVLATIVKDEEVGEVALCDSEGGCVTLNDGLHFDFDRLILMTYAFVESLVFPSRI